MSDYLNVIFVISCVIIQMSVIRSQTLQTHKRYEIETINCRRNCRIKILRQSVRDCDPIPNPNPNLM